MVSDSGRKRLPPYVSYRTFLNFIDRLQQGIPARIDRSYWSDRLSGSTGTQLMSAIRFMSLVDTNSRPTNRLRQLASAKGAQRTEVLRQIISEAFVFLQQAPFDFQTATYSQFGEAFHETFELTDGVCRKCIKFFVALASDAEIPLSPFILKRVRSVRVNTGTKPIIKRRGAKEKKNLLVPQVLEEVPEEISWDRMLLAKFPIFDPSWSDEVKLGWLETFGELKFPTLNPTWSDEVKLKWLEAFNKLRERHTPEGTP